MYRYVAKRIAIIVPVLLGASLIIFVLTRLIPGDAALVMLAEFATAEEIQNMRRILGLDQPIPVQYLKYMQGMIQGDWGCSIHSGQAVLPLILKKFMLSAQLALLSMVFAMAIGITTGFISAIAASEGRTRTDSIFRLLSAFSISIPTFWSGLMLMYIFSYRLGIFPSIGYGGIEYMVLPALNMAIWSYGVINRITRASMLDMITQSYVTTARAKGLSKRSVMLKHVLRNALIPITSITGLQLGMMFGGAFITETIFSYPGLGFLMVKSVYKRDYPVIQAGALVATTAFCFINLFVDILYTYIDPRVRLGRKESA